MQTPLTRTRLGQAVALLLLSLCALPSTAVFAADAPPAARFHHVHLNVTDTKRSIDYYKKFFGAVPVKFRGVADALLTDRSYFLFNTVDAPAPANAKTSIWHLGWGGVDGHSEYKWRTDQGITWDTDITTVGPDIAYFMYAQGPDGELVEIWTGTPHHRYNHVHLLAKDPNVTRNWYIDHLGAKGKKKHLPDPGPPPAEMTFRDPPKQTFTAVWNTVAIVDGVIFNIFVNPTAPVFWWRGDLIPELENTEGHVIDHIAFSYPDIAPVYARMKADGVEIVKDIAWDDEFKLKSFYVRAPDGVLVEIVEADPLPDASWLRHVHTKEE